MSKCGETTYIDIFGIMSKTQKQNWNCLDENPGEHHYFVALEYDRDTCWCQISAYQGHKSQMGKTQVFGFSF